MGGWVGGSRCGAWAAAAQKSIPPSCPSCCPLRLGRPDARTTGRSTALPLQLHQLPRCFSSFVQPPMPPQLHAPPPPLSQPPPSRATPLAHWTGSSSTVASTPNLFLNAACLSGTRFLRYCIYGAASEAGAVIINTGSFFNQSVATPAPPGGSSRRACVCVRAPRPPSPPTPTSTPRSGRPRTQ